MDIATPAAAEYVLGTADEEIVRLGLQHRAWRAAAFAAWQAAHIGTGDTVIDVGCGPGYASLDLAETVGSCGTVIAIDRSERFLRALESQRRTKKLSIHRHHVDLEAGEFPQLRAQHAWCRWVLCFVKNPRAVLANIATAVEPGGTVILHEYFNYASWQAAPACRELDEFVRAVMNSWSEAGGDPNIARQLPSWLEQMGMKLREVRPIVKVVEPGSLLWEWLRSFVEVGRRRLIELGYLSLSRAEEIWNAFTAFEQARGSRMLTPGVLEVIAQRET